MKKMNKKGFTLIELLAVLAILVVIMAIAIPSITSSIERSKEKDRKAKQDLAISAGELYFDMNRNKDNTNGVFVSTLIGEKLLAGVDIHDVCDENSCCVAYSLTVSKYVLNDGTESQNCNLAS